MLIRTLSCISVCDIITAHQKLQVLWTGQGKIHITAHQKLKFCVWVKEKYNRFSLSNVFNILWIF